MCLFTVVMISGCSSLAQEEAFGKNIQVKAYFCPKEDCRKVFLDTISSAKNSLKCAFYDLDLDSLRKGIGEKSRSAEVKVVIDKNNYEKQLVGGGVKVADGKQYMHNKFCIVDGNKVLTGSANPTNNGVDYNNNNLVIINSKHLADNYNKEFGELWSGVYSSGEETEYQRINSDGVALENYFCPEDGCQRKVLRALNEAGKSVYFMAFSFTDEEIADVLLFKDVNEVDVKGIFESRGSGSDYSQFRRLKDLGVDVIRDKNGKSMHHKVFIIDNESVITGSYNPTGSGNYRNDENIIIIHNEAVAVSFAEEFFSLWNEFT